MHEHAENQGNPPQGDWPKRPTQFSLRMLMLFVLLCAVYFSQLSVIAQCSMQSVGAPAALTAWLGWVLFAAFYKVNRHYDALVIHCFPMVLPLLLAFAALVSPGGSLSGFFVLGTVVANISSVASFPVAFLAIASNVWAWQSE